MKKLLILFFILSIVQMLTSCKTKSTASEEKVPVVTVKAEPVIKGDIENDISFNGTTLYQKKNLVVAPISGYVKSVFVQFGQEVQKGKLLFEIQTKERKALGPGNDPVADFGVVNVSAASDGFINELNINEPEIYVEEGTLLCNIVNNNDLMIKVNIPFEYHSILVKESKCKIILTDKTSITGSVTRILPVMDEVNQTQTVLIKPETNRQLPERLNLIIKFRNERHHDVLQVLKSSLMTNETQSEFWIMRIDPGNIAVKIPVEKGIENNDFVEVISPHLNLNDLIISEGAYGLPDSTVISILK